MRPKTKKLKRSDSLYQVQAPQSGSNLSNVRFQNRPTSGQKLYLNSNEDIVCDAESDGSDEEPAGFTPVKPLQYLMPGDSTPLVQDGINERMLSSLKRIQTASRTSKANMHNTSKSSSRRECQTQFMAAKSPYLRPNQAVLRKICAEDASRSAEREKNKKSSAKRGKNQLMIAPYNSKVVLLSKYQKTGGEISVQTRLSPKKLLSPSKKLSSEGELQAYQDNVLPQNDSIDLRVIPAMNSPCNTTSSVESSQKSPEIQYTLFLDQNQGLTQTTDSQDELALVFPKPHIMQDDQQTPIKVQLKLDGNRPQVTIEDSADAFSSPFPLHHRFESNKTRHCEHQQIQEPSVSEFHVVPQTMIKMPQTQTQQPNAKRKRSPQVRRAKKQHDQRGSKVFTAQNRPQRKLLQQYRASTNLDMNHQNYLPTKSAKERNSVQILSRKTTQPAKSVIDTSVNNLFSKIMTKPEEAPVETAKIPITLPGQVSGTLVAGKPPQMATRSKSALRNKGYADERRIVPLNPQTSSQRVETGITHDSSEQNTALSAISSTKANALIPLQVNYFTSKYDQLQKQHQSTIQAKSGTTNALNSASQQTIPSLRHPRSSFHMVKLRRQPSQRRELRPSRASALRSNALSIAPHSSNSVKLGPSPTSRSIEREYAEQVLGIANASVIGQAHSIPGTHSAEVGFRGGQPTRQIYIQNQPGVALLPSDNYRSQSSCEMRTSAEVQISDQPETQSARKVHERLTFIQKGAQKFSAFSHLESILRETVTKQKGQLPPRPPSQL